MPAAEMNWDPVELSRVSLDPVGVMANTCRADLRSARQSSRCENGALPRCCAVLTTLNYEIFYGCVLRGISLAFQAAEDR